MTVWAAPGRVNLIGEHTDYNDGLVLPFALPLTTTATVARRSDRRIHVQTTASDEAADCSLDAQPGDVSGWAAYPAGVVWALGGGDQAAGLDIQLDSDVPLGAGLSSSAALECAVAAAVDDLWRLDLGWTELARRCRQAENDFVGVPTGPMDQLAAVRCREGHALLIDCRDLSVHDVPLDLGGSGLRLLVIDTGARHSLADSAYGERRDQCAAAAAALGLDSLRDARIDAVRRLPDEVLRRRAHHVVTEISRVAEVVAVLEAGRPNDIGAFLTASHTSLRDDYEVSCAELDVAVDSALEAGALGARMTGGGFGGCAIVLCREDDVTRVVDRVEGAYTGQAWKPPTWWVATPSAGVHRIH